MQALRNCHGFSVVLVALWAHAAQAAPMGTETTYQGLLEDAGVSVTGQVDMIFTLYDAATIGNVVGTAVLFDGQAGNGAPVDVTDGLFTVAPDFGANVFDGTALWLEIQVRSPHDPTDTAMYTPLDPRQPITAAPVALQTRGMFVEDSTGNVGIGTTSPAEMLEVAGAIHSTSTGFKFPDGTVQSSAAIGAAVGTGGRNPLQIALLRWYKANESGATFNVGSTPERVAFDGAHIWVTNFGSRVFWTRALGIFASRWIRLQRRWRRSHAGSGFRRCAVARSEGFGQQVCCR